MNKGLEIRAKKLKKKATKRNTIKETQIDVCRFIDFKNPKTERVNGKYRFVGFQTLSGLQVENKLYYVENNREKFVFTNKPQAKVLLIYSETEISNFPPMLLERYEKMKSKNQINNDDMIKND